jgi:hypothetical protein
MPDVIPALDNECFFIAPIGEEGSEIRHRSDGVLKFIVSHAAEELGLTAIRADQLAAPGQITLQVIDHVLQAKAAVADLTGRNPNVFYELAVRHSARLPVALIVASDDEPLPFDIAQMRVIRFDHRDLESADQCRQAIVAHLREAIDGAVDSPIGASIDLRALGGGNRVERSIAEILTGIEELSRLQRTVVDSGSVMAAERDVLMRQADMLLREIQGLHRQRQDLQGRLDEIGALLEPAVEAFDSPDEAKRKDAVEHVKAIWAGLVAPKPPTHAASTLHDSDRALDAATLDVDTAARRVAKAQADLQIARERRRLEAEKAKVRSQRAWQAERRSQPEGDPKG